MSIEIRIATEQDLSAVRELFAQLTGPSGVLPPSEARERLAWMHRNPDHRVYVATDQGRVLGTYTMLYMRNLAHRGRPCAIVEDVVVDEAARGKGIGRGMMEHAVALARAADCYKLALSSHVRREQAHRFYESLGFTRHGYSFEVVF